MSTAEEENVVSSSSDDEHSDEGDDVSSNHEQEQAVIKDIARKRREDRRTPKKKRALVASVAKAHKSLRNNRGVFQRASQMLLSCGTPSKEAIKRRRSKRAEKRLWRREKDETTGNFKMINTRTGETRILRMRKFDLALNAQNDAASKTFAGREDGRDGFAEIDKQNRHLWEVKFDEETGKRFLLNRITKAKRPFVSEKKLSAVAKIVRSAKSLRIGHAEGCEGEDEGAEGGQRSHVVGGDSLGGSTSPHADRHASSFRGVRWSSDSHRWLAYLKINDRILDVGTFLDERDAAKAHDAAAKRFIGPSAAYNFPDDVFFGALDVVTADRSKRRQSGATADEADGKETVSTMMRTKAEQDRIAAAPWTIFHGPVVWDDYTYDVIFHRDEKGVRVFAFYDERTIQRKFRWVEDLNHSIPGDHDLRLWPNKELIDALKPRLQVVERTDMTAAEEQMKSSPVVYTIALRPERRRDPADGQFYTKEEFVLYYGKADNAANDEWRCEEWELAVSEIRAPKEPRALRADSTRDADAALNARSLSRRGDEKGGGGGKGKRCGGPRHSNKSCCPRSRRSSLGRSR
eukprot:g4201.t1